MKIIRILFVSFLCILIVYWSFNGFSSAVTTGLIHDLMIGLVLLILLVANCIAGVFSFQKKHIELANKITLFSIGTFFMVVFTLYYFPKLISGSI